MALIITMIIALSLSCGCSMHKSDENSDYVLLDEVPLWDGDPSVSLNGGKPEFTEEEIERARKHDEFELFDEMDKYGRCGTAAACVGPETMPEGERGSIGMVQPSGWQISKYDFIDNGGYLYNRCHLIGWQLTGQNDEIRNLITGTRYMNVQGMLPFENQVAEYVRRTGNHVLYRATPVFKGKELVARGVVLEAYSLEDDGKGVLFNVYCYNVQPGVSINYQDGTNHFDEETLDANTDVDKDAAETSSEIQELDIPAGVTYILNNNTMRFHRLDCEGAKTIQEHNREWFYGSREEAIEEGYVPCGMCNP